MRIPTLLASLGAAAVMAAAPAQGPKYIFYCIGDGMGMAHALSAQVYNRMVLGNEQPVLMMQFPVAGQSTTHSWSSPVTDSAASGTALATGVKTRNGMLGMDADSVAVTSIAKELHDRGWGVGLVTSVSPDDATPGAFYAHVPSRRLYYDIGRQMAESGYEFVGGSILRAAKDSEGKPTGLLDHFDRHGVAVAYGMEQLDTTARRVLLLNPEAYQHSNQIGFTIDSLPGALNLPDMTLAALNHLKRTSPDKFFMMIEGGNIDYGGHANDGGGIVKEVLNFNQAIAHAYDFYLQHPDETLIVVTADHETGGFAIGNGRKGYAFDPAYYDAQRISKDRFADQCRAILKSRRIYEWDDMRQMLGELLGFWSAVPVNEAQTQALRDEFERCISGQASEDKKTLYNSFNNFTELVFNTLDTHTGAGFTTNGHTGGLVPLYAIGVGCEAFTGLNDNTTYPKVMRRLTGIWQ